MPLWTTIALVALIVCSALVILYWGAMVLHILLTVRQVPTARAGLRKGAREEGRGGGELPAVCVVVPAHNEEGVIEGLAASLAAQDYPPERLRFLFTLDRCTDRTREIIERVFAGDPRVEVIEVESCPEGWAGKVHALWSSLPRSEGATGAEMLLFADADTIFDPACVRATTALMRDRDLELLSLLSTQRTKTWFEWVVQPAACLELIRQYPIRRSNSAEHRRPFANGQFMQFRREAYERIGGHSCVKGEIFEDVHMARVAEKHKLRIGVVLADGLLHCRMYRDWASFDRGWKRIFSEAANLKLARINKAAWRLRALGTLLPAAAVVSAAWGWWVWRTGDEEASGLGMVAMATGAAGALVFLVAIGTTCRLARTPVVAAALFPIGAWMTGGIMRRAAADLAANRPTLWAGRAYQRVVR